MYLIGYHAAISPMKNTINRTAIISYNSILTGYASIIKVPLPSNPTSLYLICSQHIRSPAKRPITAPIKDIKQPSNKNTFFITDRSVPRLLKVEISNFFSRINIVNEPITLNEATTSINTRIRKIIFFRLHSLIEKFILFITILYFKFSS